MATWSAEKVVWQLSLLKAQLQADQAMCQQSNPEQSQLGGLVYSMQSLCPPAGNGHVLFLGYRSQGLRCRSTLLDMRMGGRTLCFFLSGRRWECLELSSSSGLLWLQTRCASLKTSFWCHLAVLQAVWRGLGIAVVWMHFVVHEERAFLASDLARASEHTNLQQLKSDHAVFSSPQSLQECVWTFRGRNLLFPSWFS